MSNEPVRREIGRTLAGVRLQRRQVLGPDRIREELVELDEQVLGRRRLASEERRYRRLEAELEHALSATSNRGT